MSLFKLMLRCRPGTGTDTVSFTVRSSSRPGLGDEIARRKNLTSTLLIGNCNLDAVASTFLGPIESPVRKRDQFGDVECHIECGITTGDESDGNRRVYIVPVDGNRSLRKTATQPFRDSECSFEIGVVQNAREFLAADPADEIAGTQG